jgi:hypothetical protein
MPHIHREHACRRAPESVRQRQRTLKLNDSAENRRSNSMTRDWSMSFCTPIQDDSLDSSMLFSSSPLICLPCSFRLKLWSASVRFDSALFARARTPRLTFLRQLSCRSVGRLECGVADVAVIVVVVLAGCDVSVVDLVHRSGACAVQCSAGQCSVAVQLNSPSASSSSSSSSCAQSDNRA